MTIDPPARVAAMLSLFRPVADEIVVAVDSRVHVGELRAYDDVADRVLRFEFQPPVDRPRAWLHQQCRGDWILGIDGDEVPSGDLVESLPELVAARDVQHVAFPRRWLYPNADTWLGELPWWPDFQIRLVRNDATLAFRGGVHGGVMPAAPSLHVDTPLYHLDCIVKSKRQRRKKARDYEAQQPAREAYGGGPLNATMYVPERRRVTDLCPVPVEDRELIDCVLGATAVPTSIGPYGSVPVAPASEIDAVAPTRRLPRDAYRATLALYERGRRMAPGERRPVHVRVTNDGTVTWPWGLDPEPQIRVSYHWRTTDGRTVTFEGMRSPFTARLAPGGSQIVPVWVEAPSDSGIYVLEFDLVHEHVRWFETPLAVEIDVSHRARR
jgi:hypothetical protein